jgi:hypothetical protein
MPDPLSVRNSNCGIYASILPASITLTLTLNRATLGQAAMVELVVTDGCGDWPTFVGGGPSAF